MCVRERERECARVCVCVLRVVRRVCVGHTTDDDTGGNECSSSRVTTHLCYAVGGADTFSGLGSAKPALHSTSLVHSACVTLYQSSTLCLRYTLPV